MVSGRRSTTSGAVLGCSPEMDSGRNVDSFYCHVSTEESDWSRLHSFHAENSYKTKLARVCGRSLPDRVSQAASLAVHFFSDVFPRSKHLDVRVISSEIHVLYADSTHLFVLLQVRPRESEDQNVLPRYRHVDVRSHSVGNVHTWPGALAGP